MNVGEQRPVRINCLYSFLETEDFHHMTGVSNEKEINVLWCIRKCPSIFCVCHPTCYWFYKKLYSNQLEQQKKIIKSLTTGVFFARACTTSRLQGNMCNQGKINQNLHKMNSKRQFKKKIFPQCKKLLKSDH